MISVASQSPPAGSTGSTSWPDYAPIAIAALAFLSLILGLSNRRIAKRALRLSEAQEARRDFQFFVYLNEAASWRGHSIRERLLGAHMLVANPTDRPGSLVNAELHVTYTVNGYVSTVKVPHVSDRETVDLPADLAPIILPAPLEANGAVSGWFLFRVADELTGGQPIDRYDIVIRDVHGVFETLQVTFFRESGNAKAT